MIDKITQAPLAGAYVTMYCSATPSAAISDASGHFSFVNARNYGYQCGSFSVARAGYLRRNVYVVPTSSQSAPNFRVALTPQAVIAGKILDEDGFPVDGAQVSIFRYRTVGGQRQLERVSDAVPNRQSNDLGEYRKGGLRAGKYYVRVSSTGSARNWDATYLPQYYPSASTPEEATAIELKAGDQRTDIHFHLVRRKGAAVEGRLILPEGADIQHLLVNLNSDDDFVAGMGGSAFQDGSFVFSHVAPGNYTLAVWTANFPGRVVEFGGSLPVAVGQTDVRNLVVNCYKAGPQDIAGKVNYAGNDGRRPAKVALRYPDGSIREAPIEPDGSFLIKGAPMGPVSVHVMPSFDGAPSGEMTFSMGQDTERPGYQHQLKLDGGPVEPLQITVKTPEALVQTNVRVVDATGQPAAGVTLLFVGTTPEHRAVVPTDPSGAHDKLGLVPDQYHVYLADDDDGYDLSVVDDADFLSAHANDFPPVRISAGANQTITLTLHQ